MIKPVAESVGKRPIIRLVGVGGGAVNMITYMINAGVDAADFIAVNTDQQHLELCPAEKKILLDMPTDGLGAGGKPEIAREAALKERQTIEDVLRGAHMVIIATVLGGGTGTGAAPVVAEVAKSLGILTAAIVVLPFCDEGQEKMRTAFQGLELLKQHVDAYAIIPNDNLLKALPPNTHTETFFNQLDAYVAHILMALVDMITQPGYINRDLQDVKSVLSGAGRFVIGVGVGEGENRAEQAFNNALFNPLLEGTDLRGAKAALLFVTQPSDGVFEELRLVKQKIWEVIASDAFMSFGFRVDPKLNGQLKVTAIVSRLIDGGVMDVSSMLESEESATRRSGVAEAFSVTQVAKQPAALSSERPVTPRPTARTVFNEANLRPAFDEEPSELDPYPAYLRKRTGEYHGFPGGPGGPKA